MGNRLTNAREVASLGNAPSIGDFRVHRGGIAGPHPADNMTATMAMGDGAFVGFINPQSFADGGPEWVCRYGNVESIRYTVASLLGDYDYLLSGEISDKEAIRRLRLLRAGRAALAQEGGGDGK